MYALGLAILLPLAITSAVPLIVSHNESAAQRAQWQRISSKLDGAANIQSTCSKDMRGGMPACHQFGSMWCWATGIAELVEYYTGSGPAQCQGLECQVVSWCPKPPTCASHRGPTCCPLSAHQDCGSDGATLDMMTEAATHFTGKKMVLSNGPMSQAVLDAKLQAGHPILMLIGEQSPSHVVSVAGCGNGAYYFHDPETAAGNYEARTYDKLLTLWRDVKWLDTVAAADDETPHFPSNSTVVV